MLKPLTAIDSRTEFLGQKFDRDGAVQTDIAGAVDTTHTARADDRHDFVRTKPDTWTEHDGRILSFGSFGSFGWFERPRYRA